MDRPISIFFINPNFIQHITIQGVGLQPYQTIWIRRLRFTVLTEMKIKRMIDLNIPI